MANGYGDVDWGWETPSYAMPTYDWGQDVESLNRLTAQDWGLPSTSKGFDWGSLIKPGIGAGINLLGSLLKSRSAAEAAKAGTTTTTQRELQPWATGAAAGLTGTADIIKQLAEAEFTKPPMSETQQTYYGAVAPGIAAMGPEIYNLSQEALLSQLIGGGFPSQTYAEAQLPYGLLQQASQQELAEQMARTYGPWFGRSGDVNQILAQEEGKRQANLATLMSQIPREFAQYEARIPEVQRAAATQLANLPTTIGPTMAALGVPRTMEQATLDRYLQLLTGQTGINQALLQMGLVSPTTTVTGTPTGTPSTIDYLLASLGGGLSEAGVGAITQILKALGLG